MRVFDAFLTEGASIPVTVIDGWYQARERMSPVPIGSITPSSERQTGWSTTKAFS